MPATITVHAPAGPVVARLDGDVVRAQGIPYADAERFAPPEPKRPWTEPFPATGPGPVAPQLAAEIVETLLRPVEDAVVDEHCQTLSITAPADRGPDEQLPVMVWLHGGSYEIGAGDLRMYDPHDLVVEQRVVVVSITFRLGVLGFLGDGVRAPANLGLLDVIEGLRWIARNVAAFGGDPDRVTLFGQSAGGDLVAHLMVSAGTEGLFRRAVIQSAPFGLSHRKARMHRAMLRAAGRIGPETPLDEVLERQVAAGRAAGRYGLNGGMPFGVQYGYAPLPAERDLDAAWRAVAPRVDVLIGAAADEAAAFVPGIPVLRRAARTPVLRALLRWWLVRPLTRVIYAADVRRFTERHRAAGGTAVSYRLRRAPGVRARGAVHMSDLPLLLGGRADWAGTRFLPERDWAEVERRGPRMRAAWAEFARTGAVSVPDDEGLTFDRG